MKLTKIPFIKLTLQKEINKKLFTKADSLVGKVLSCPRIKLPTSHTLIVDGVETGMLLSDFAQQLRRKNADITTFTLVDYAGRSLTLVLNHNSKTKERGSWVPFNF